jgi:hypothetical protein
MPPVVHRLPDGHFNSSPCKEQLERECRRDHSRSAIVVGDGFRTNRVKDRRNVHDRRIQERNSRHSRRPDPRRLIFATARAAN